MFLGGASASQMEAEEGGSFLRYIICLSSVSCSGSEALPMIGPPVCRVHIYAKPQRHIVPAVFLRHVLRARPAAAGLCQLFGRQRGGHIDIFAGQPVGSLPMASMHQQVVPDKVC